MAVKIRLRRMGAKKTPFYRVVVADSRYPRDGRFIEEIGTYNPLVEPSEFKVDVEKTKKWIANGAQPTDTVKASVCGRTIAAEIDMIVIIETGCNATNAENTVGVGRSDNCPPGVVVALVAGAVAHQYAFSRSHVAGFGYEATTVHIPCVVAVFAVPQRGADDLSSILVGPFHSHLPPHLFFERFSINLGASQKEFGTSGETVVDGFFMSQTVV